MVQRTNSYTDLSMVKTKGAKKDLPDISKRGERTSLPVFSDHINATKSQRQSVQGTYIIPKLNGAADGEKNYHSSRKEYFNSKSQSINMLAVESSGGARNESVGTKRRNQENITATMAHDNSISQISTKTRALNNNTFSAWGTGAGKSNV